jgi:hypothetical protein
VPKIVHQLVLTELRFSVLVLEFETPNLTVADRAQKYGAAWPPCIGVPQSLHSRRRHALRPPSLATHSLPIALSRAQAPATHRRELLHG